MVPESTLLVAPAVKRRICWPNPDSVCLQGGCTHCNDKPFRDLEQIRRYAEANGMAESYRYGCVLRRGNAEFSE